MSVVITIRDAVKRYGGNTVISGLSLHIGDKVMVRITESSSATLKGVQEQ